MAVEQLSRFQLRVGDHVQWTPAADDDLPTTGPIIAIRPPTAAGEDFPEYVVQVTPTILGIYRAIDLIRLGQALPEGLQEMLVP